MSKITPFRGIRPVRDKVHLVATRPIYSYKQHVLHSKLEDNPFTFLHIINPEFGGERTTQPNTPERFQLVCDAYVDFIEDKVLIQDEVPSIYIYRQTKDGKEFIGVIAGADNQEYRDDKIKKHEATLTKREEMFIDYLDIVGYNAEPVLLSYPHNEKIAHTLDNYTKARPEYEFTTTDRVKHELWVLDEKQTAELQQLFLDVPALYIADGHHRSASSVGLENRRITENRSEFKNEKAFLAFLIDENRLQILEFNRVVKSLKSLTESELIEKLTLSFDVSKCPEKTTPSCEHELTMCVKGNWYLLKCKPEIIDANHPVKSLDAQLLTDFVLQPILGIEDLKTDTNIEFVSGAVPIENVVESIQKGTYEVAFFLFPVSMEQVKRVADNQMIMPPKSTWVEPKLRSGMTIYAINE